MVLSNHEVSVATDQQDPKYLRHLLTAMLCLALTWVTMVATCLLMALLVSALGRNMSWFTRVYNLVPLYILPTLAAMILLQNLFRDHVFKVSITAVMFTCIC